MNVQQIDVELLKKLHGGKYTDGPCLIKRSNKQYAFATNNYGAAWICAEGLGLPLEQADTDFQPKIDGFMSRLPEASTAIDLAAFKAWLEPPQWSVRQQCEQCNGKKKTPCPECGGTGTHECDCGDIHDCGECDGSGDHDCPNCDDGYIFKPAQRYGVFLGMLIDRELFAEYLSVIPDKSAWFGMGRLTVYFRGDGWGAMCMGVSGEISADFPVWEAEHGLSSKQDNSGDS